MERRVINPWTWQDEMAFVQANEISGMQRVLVCSGQTSVDAEGNPVQTDDMRAQIGQALDNLEAVLSQAGFTLADVVRMNYYTTDVDRFFEAYDVIATRVTNAGCKSAGSVLGVSRLAFPELLIEIEATAAK
jgi:enamine deaminase RidA (YjgF/YER057c/UK114 family)